MSKLFSSIIFSLLLLFQNTALAQEDTTAPVEENIEDPEVSEETEAEEQESQPEAEEQEAQPEPEEEVEPKEELSEAEKEALAAEAAELREAGMGEEPLIE